MCGKTTKISELESLLAGIGLLAAKGIQRPATLADLNRARQIKSRLRVNADP
jgi:hypothetical protein